MDALSEKDLLALLILSDEKGHSITDLSSELFDHKGSVTKLLEKLVNKRFVYIDYYIDNKSQTCFNKEKETACFIEKDLDVFRTIVKQLQAFKNPEDSFKQRTSYKFPMKDLADGRSYCDIFGLAKRKPTSKNVAMEDLISLELSLDYLGDSLSQYIRDHFSPKTRSDLERYREKSRNPKMKDTIQRDLVGELNKLLDDENLYSPERFRHLFPLPLEAIELMEQKPKGLELNRLNRILLEHAYGLNFISLQVSPFALDSFLSSNYTKSLIKEYGIIILAEILKPHLKMTDLLAFVSEALRNELATADERDEIIHGLIAEGLIIVDSAYNFPIKP